MAVVCPISRKKLSIFTSATIPYGLPRHSRISGTGIVMTTKRKSERRMYFSPRGEISSQRGAVRLRGNHGGAVCHSHPEIVPTGQVQRQSALRYSNEIERN